MSLTYQECLTLFEGDDPEEENDAWDRAAVTFFELDNPVYVVSNAGDGWSSNPTPAAVAHDAQVRLRAVVHIVPTMGDEAYFWGFDEGPVTLVGLGQVTVYKWNESLWGTAGKNVTIDWKTLMPYIEHLTEPGNDRNDPNYKAYTNVDTSTKLWLGANGVNGGSEPVGEGDTYDIIEYQQTGADTGWAITASASIGTRRYRISNCYISGPVGEYSPGKQDLTTRCNLVWQGDDDAYDRGVKNTVMRIVRRSNRSSTYISHIEAYLQVPWIFGSAPETNPPVHQTERYIGFDCADLLVGAARAAGLYGDPYTSANGLVTALPERGSYGDVYKLEGGVVKRASDGEPADIVIGTGDNDLHIGDIIICNRSGYFSQDLIGCRQ